MNIQVLGRDSRGYFYHTGEKSTRNVRIDRLTYDLILIAADAVQADYRQHAHSSGFTLHFDNGFDYQPAQDAPKTHGTKKVVHISRADGTTETDAEFWARQPKLTTRAANEIIERQEEQNDLLTSIRGGW